MRLDKFICNSTSLTRDQALREINAGAVLVNGTMICEPSQQVHELNCITLKGQRLEVRASRYFMLHKVEGTVCSHADDHYPSIFQGLSIESPENLHLVGRLDVDTSGLVLLTDDGRWSFSIMSPRYHCKKVYRVGLRDRLDDAQSEAMKQSLLAGIVLQGEATATRPAKMEVVNNHEILLTLTEGRYHQVKRMMAALGNRVVNLHRQQVGPLCLDLEPGAYRELSQAEVLSFDCPVRGPG